MNGIQLSDLQSLGLEEAKRTNALIEVKLGAKTSILTPSELHEMRVWCKGKFIKVKDLEFTNSSLTLLTALGQNWKDKQNIELTFQEHYSSNSNAVGYVPFTHYTERGNFKHVIFPVLYPTIIFEEGDALNGECIIPIGVRNYQIIYASPVEDEQGKIRFIETLEEPSKFTVTTMQHRKESGLLPIPTQRSNIYWFGQPEFIQSPVFPAKNGKAAYLLFRYESGWGDAGNEHVFIQLDESNRPSIAWSEVSCC